MLLAEFVRRAAPDAVVRGPMAVQPDAVAAPTKAGTTLDVAQFLEIAERLTRQDVVHSLVAVKAFLATGKEGEKERVLRVEKCQGFSGPEFGTPALGIVYPPGAAADVVLLDDTGNRFRKVDAGNAWPPEVTGGAVTQPLVVYKLHRPLPTGRCPNALWDAVASRHPRNRVVVLAVEDLRKAGAPISLGLSWERTALDVVWHLLNNEVFAQLRDCPRLVVRLGLEGVVVWHRRAIPPMTEAEKNEAQKKAEEAGKKMYQPRPLWDYNAWLVYDPEGIEGCVVAATPGSMVACGSAFTGGMTAHLAALPDSAFKTLREGGPTWEKRDDEDSAEIQHLFMDAVEAGLRASRRLLALGFGNPKGKPSYPGAELFQPTDGDVKYARHAIPIIPDASTPDRGYWRLLESLFENRTALLHTVVANVAISKKVKAERLPWKAAEVKQLAAGKEEEARRKLDAAHAAWLLEAAPRACYGKLLTYDRREIEQYRSLYTLLRDYLQNPNPERPLSFAVFGPPGAGKSFGVKEVAASLKGQIGCKEAHAITFNLSLYQKPDELAAAFHLVRDKALEGKVPLVFFDEFDTALDRNDLGWLRCFLAPMQDGKFLDRGSEHPIGPAIFVFAGGTCGTFKEFNSHANMDPAKFKAAKGPDFLSRLRAMLDIPSLNLPLAAEPEPEDPKDPRSRLIQPPGTFDPYGPTEDFPSTPSILLRRASILACNLKKKAPGLERADGSFHVDAAILRALLLLPEFNHGNRSFEAILDMSHLVGADHFTPALLPAPAQLPLHANASLFVRLVGTAYPYSAEDRDRIAKEIHRHFLEQRKSKGEYIQTRASHQVWADLPIKFRDSNREQADDLPRKLLALGFWLRKTGPARPEEDLALLDYPKLQLPSNEAEKAARQEHDRWVALERRKGTVWGMKAVPQPPFTHPCILSWNHPDLAPNEKTKDLDAVQGMPRYLAAAGYEVFKP